MFGLTSVIQGSGLGPASYLVTASDLHPVTDGNCIFKYADDTYLVVPATNSGTQFEEIANIEKWAADNNLRLNSVSFSYGVTNKRYCAYCSACVPQDITSLML